MSTFLGHAGRRAARRRAPARRRSRSPTAARTALADTQLRRNLGHATSTIRAKRAAVVAEVPDWEALRRAGEAIKAATMARLDEHLERLEREVTARGGVVHWARDANEANRIVTELVRATGADRGRQGQVDGHPGDRAQRGARRRRASRPYETDLAELIVQLGARQALAHPGAGDPPQPRRDPGDLPARDGRRRPGAHRRAAGGWPMAARRAPAAQVPAPPRSRSPAPTSPSPRPARSLVVESEGNGRMCLTLPRDADHRDGHREARARPGATSRCSCSCCRARRPASG